MQDGPASSAPRSPAAARLIERERELAVLGSAIERGLGGENLHVVVEGPPGIGKSALLGVAAELAAQRGATVLRARGGELERDFPHGVVRQLFDRPDRTSPRMTGAAALAAPALGLGAAAQAQGADADFSAMHGLYWLVAGLADERPLAILVDDLHWVDAASLRFLAYLAGRVEGLRVALITATRPPDLRESPVLAALVSAPGAQVLRLRELTAGGSAEWVSRQLDTSTPRFAAACHTASGGNPFLLAELVDALREDGIAPDDNAAGQIPALTPHSVSRSVLLRLARLPAEATTLARAVVTLGESVHLAQAAALGELGAERAAELADVLVEAHVLAGGRPLTFVHPIIGEAIRSDMRGSEASRLHARAARLLDAQGEPADRLAAHLMHSDPAHDPWVASTLREAARLAAGRGAIDDASRWLRRAVAEGLADERPALLRELGEAEWLSGRPDEGIERLRGATASATGGDERARAALSLARALASTGRVAEASNLLRDLSTGAIAGSAWEHRVDAEMATCAMLSGEGVDEAAERLERSADAPGDTVDELLLLCSLATIRVHTGSAPGAIALARRGLGGDRLLEAGEPSSFPYLGALITLCVADDHDEARMHLARALGWARTRGSSVAFAYACGTLATLGWISGDVRLCEAMAREALEPEFPNRFADPVLRSYLALALIERGELDAADDAVAALRDGPDRLFVQSAHALCAIGRLLREQGRADEAVVAFRRLLEQERSAYTPHPPWRIEAAECLLAVGDDVEARSLLHAQATIAGRWGAASGIGAVQRAVALAAGGLDERIALLTEAQSTLAASPARLERARTYADLGVALTAAGRQAEARETLREAVELAAACGATSLQRRAHDALIAAGARPQRERFTGVDSLTPTERSIAMMALTGMPNAEIAQARFVTRSTVEKHLSHAYEKLGIESREQLRSVLGEA